MRLIGLVMVCIIAFTLTGCWSRRELTEVSFTGLIGLDWENGAYLVTAVVLSPRRSASESGVTQKQEVWTISEHAPSQDQAFSRLDQILSRSLTLTHVRGIVYGEALARRGIGPTIDHLLRSVEMRPTAWVAVTLGRAADLLKARPRQETAISDSPIGYQDAANRRSSVTPARRLSEVANLLQEEGVDLTLPLFRLAGTEPPKLEGALGPHPESPQEIIYGGAGVFVSDRLVGWLSPAATRGLNWARNRAVHGAVSAPCPDEDRWVVYRLRKSRAKIETAMVGQTPRSRIRVKVIADVNEIGCAKQGLENGGVHGLERLLEAEVKSQITSGLAQMRASGSDFFGLGQALFRRSPAAFLARAKRWPEIVTDLPVEVQVTAQVPRLGQLNDSYRWNPY